MFFNSKIQLFFIHNYFFKKNTTNFLKKKITLKSFFFFLLILKFYFNKNNVLIKIKKKKNSFFNILKAPYKNKLAQRKYQIQRFFFYVELVFNQNNLNIKNLNDTFLNKIKKIGNVFFYLIFFKIFLFSNFFLNDRNTV